MPFQRGSYAVGKSWSQEFKSLIYLLLCVTLGQNSDLPYGGFLICEVE